MLNLDVSLTSPLPFSFFPVLRDYPLHPPYEPTYLLTFILISITSQQTACCSLPAIEAEYTPKGTYETIADLKTYVVGDASSKKLIVYT